MITIHSPVYPAGTCLGFRTCTTPRCERLLGIIPHTETGFSQIDYTQEKLGLSVSECIIDLESAHMILLDHLWYQGYPQEYVLPLNLVKSARWGIRQRRARSDPSAARLIAGILYTDQSRL